MKKVRHGCATDLEGDVVVANADLELLLSDNVFLGPVRVVFPDTQGRRVSTQRRGYEGRDAHLVISLDSMIRFSSFTTSGPIHTARRKPHGVSISCCKHPVRLRNMRGTHSLCG